MRPPRLIAVAEFDLETARETPDTAPMIMRQLLRPLALLAICSAAILACGDTAWEGKATNTNGTFNFGPVSFTVKGKQIVDFRVARVTTSGCGGMKDVIVPTGITIKGTEFAGSFQPIPGIDDTIIVTGTITGTSASGTFSEGPTCRNSGKFTASPK